MTAIVPPLRPTIIPSAITTRQTTDQFKTVGNLWAFDQTSLTALLTPCYHSSNSLPVWTCGFNSAISNVAAPAYDGDGGVGGSSSYGHCVFYILN
jgi:hypothetical protein